jgi:hypothetical protein
MAVLNDPDRFHLVMDTTDRPPQTGDQGISLKPQLKDKLIEHMQYIKEHGLDLPKIRNWKLKGLHGSIPDNPCPENDDGNHWNWRPAHPGRRCLCDRDDLSKRCEGY